MKRIFIFIFCVHGLLFAQNTEIDVIKNDIVKYVEENYSKTLEQIPLGKETAFGFNNRDMFDRCVTGNPIMLLKINNESEIEKTNEWRVPLLINGKYVILLTVVEFEQNYEIVDIGGKLLAELIDNYNNENEKIAFMLRDHRKKTDYVSFEYNSLSDKNFYKIQYETKNMYQTDGISLEEIIELHNIDNE